jgi:hypothetical protein
MGNEKPESLRRVENALWRALMNMALGADQCAQLNEFIHCTSDVGNIDDTGTLQWFVKSTPDFHHYRVIILGCITLRNQPWDFSVPVDFGSPRAVWINGSD